MLPRLFTNSTFDDLFDDFNGLNNEVSHKLYGKRSGQEMLTDIKEHDDHYDVIIDLPGFKKEDITVELNDGYLSVTASKGLKEDEENKSGKLIRQERYYGTMSRSFYVGNAVTYEDIKAKYDGGVLTICVLMKDTNKEVSSNKITIE